MYLKQIIAHGFKSFADKVNIDFMEGVTGIVGPNGSGKSNIVDAVKWVLGEQSVKSLRGEGSMTDIIFSGSKTRNPSNFASVTLIFDNSDNHLKIDYKEVAIKRTVYRNGDNEYYLNKERCRLKDIVDLLIDSGSGKESFNIFSQGDIANVLSSKPEDRRSIFESAAGVLKYKKRKCDAIKKLDRTHDNIDRLNDIINELEIQLEPLKNQSEQAGSYLKAKEELEGIEVSLIASDIEKYKNEYVVIKENINILESNILDLSTNSNIDYSLLESKKSEYNRLTDKLYSLQSELLTKTSAVEKLNSEKTILTERKKYEVEDVKLHNNIIDLTENELNLKNKINGLEDDIKNIKDQIKTLSISKEETSLVLENYKLDRQKLLMELSNNNKEKDTLEYKIKMIESSIESNSDLSYSVKSILNNPKLIGIHGVIGKLIDFEDKYAVAIDIALGASSQFIVCDNEKNASNAIDYLKSNNLGRATFFPLNVIEKKNVDQYTYNLIKENISFVGIASSLVKYDSKYDNIIQNQLGNIIVASDLNSANEISKIISHKYRVVTLDGDILHVGGSITGGINKKGSSLILDKMELDRSINIVSTLKKSISVIEGKLLPINSNIDIYELKVNDINSKRLSFEQIISTKLDILNDYKENISNIQKNLNSTNNILENKLSEEEDTIIKKYFEELSNKENISKEIINLNKEIDSYKNEINDMEHNIKESNYSMNKKQNELKDAEIKITKIDIRLESLLQVLNEEYGITFEKAKNDYVLYIPEDIARRKVNELRRIVKDIGMVNINAIEEYKKVNDRYEFLTNQKSDLYKAENTLLDIIKEMDIIMKDNFMDTFKLIQNEFKNVFVEMFGGGSAELSLTDPNNVLETGIEIVALPPGKKLQHISLLSGGEKALTAIALLFSILKISPVPFCLLDEVEAPLDEVNVDNFGKFLKRFEAKTQFIVITHKKRTMEYADTLYGITMQESGVSKLVSVRLNEI